MKATAKYLPTNESQMISWKSRRATLGSPMVVAWPVTLLGLLLLLPVHADVPQLLLNPQKPANTEMVKAS